MMKLSIICGLFVALVAAQTPIQPGLPYYATTQFRSWTYFSLQLSESTINFVQLVTSVDSGAPFYYAAIDYLPSLRNYDWNYENNTGGSLSKYFYNPNIDLTTGNYSNSILYIGVYGYTSTKYSLKVLTQGPIVLQNRQAALPAYPVPNTYVFYKLTIDAGLRSFQAVVAPDVPPAQNGYVFYMSNSTSVYPVLRNRLQYSSDYHYRTQCLTINYPYPGSYRLGLITSRSNYTIQFVENGLNKCTIQY